METCATRTVRAGWTINDALDINNDGWIIVSAALGEYGAAHAFVLAPVYTM